uniref:Cadherin domain-containing protein n=1 Tax=Hippocampus comes TaxID=109280 RepID=A0A3Q2Y6S6_HIPCM
LPLPLLLGHSGVEIKIIDVNDNAPEIIVTSLTSPVPEDAARGTVIALISTRDPDSKENGKVTLRLPSESHFKLNSSVSNHYSLVTNGPLDREINDQYSVEISATDYGKPPLSSAKTIVVKLLDVNDNPPVFSQPRYTIYVKENSAPGQILCSVSASDPDAGENAKVSYSIVDSKVDDVSVSSYVYVNSENGSIYMLQRTSNLPIHFFCFIHFSLNLILRAKCFCQQLHNLVSSCFGECFASHFCVACLL